MRHISLEEDYADRKKQESRAKRYTLRKKRVLLRIKNLSGESPYSINSEE
ncbi:MAG: hypothetical protein LBL90_12880 [Prevotellaceae bacterium]|jgi:hypothetical protein|nr:hypothetical protein [Prevotellaceae bacterium]